MVNASVTMVELPLKSISAAADAEALPEPETVSVPVRMSPGSSVAKGYQSPYQPGPKVASTLSGTANTGVTVTKPNSRASTKETKQNCINLLGVERRRIPSSCYRSNTPGLVNTLIATVVRVYGFLSVASYTRFNIADKP